MAPTAEELRTDALRIWQAGVDAVSPARLIQQYVRLDKSWFIFGEESDESRIDLSSIDRIAVIGAGKAAARMATALEQVFGPQLIAEKHIEGWVNVPADCLLPTARIHLHAGRPAGVNEPRAEGVTGTREILQIVSSLGPRDLCICLIAGGGSALLVAPVPEITLDQMIRVTQLLSGAGANIEQLNTVRRQLSRVKGGGLARACRAGRLETLIISDVLGDPLEVIASGPTVPGTTTVRDALDVFEQLRLTNHADAQPTIEYLKANSDRSTTPLDCDEPATCRVTNHIIANNATAVDAAGVEAERLGYSHAMMSATASEGPAEDVGRHLAEMARRMRSEPGPDCLITGGEPVVHLADKSVRGKGGRNQQLVLAALAELGDCRDIALLSGGTDGEDGPTDAAGAVIDQLVAEKAKSLGLDVSDFLLRNDAYHFFEPVGGLIKTGPTHTNVCDVRVVTVSRS